ncbi:Gfo/Idh/MocA family oxidoreductase [Oribacterium sp. FC2011]|uniref:Gfo/Idh/MocA family oxidoreductase n=1 Tax=Oribacterium sp. FC2011 TaxID=1408311 RepID=UPI0004E0F1B3|nr:Gfo/Idh/MocA family oxidoreductase [Oribacterium sp. FC2011]
MVKVITYGSYDLLHYGHIRLLERAKALGDYLIVGVTSDDYDKTRGKINLQQSLMERVEAVRATGLADEIIIEEYEGQKIDDIKKYDIDIFTVGSDWDGYFDYLKEYCKVVYLPRTDGVSSSDIREKKRLIRLGLLGDAKFLNKVWAESKSVNGIHITAVCTKHPEVLTLEARAEIGFVTDDYNDFLSAIDAVYIRSLPQNHYEHIRVALEAGKHVLCESPLTIDKEQVEELIKLASEKNLILMEAIKTAYATAYSRLLLILKGGKIGDVVSADATCTSMRENEEGIEWNSIHEWGPTALLPIFQILGTDFKQCSIVSRFDKKGRDCFTKIDFVYDHSVGSIKIGDGVKSEGELIITGSEGYLYVPAPWWKTDYFEVRYEDQSKNKRYFYQLDGEGIRYELVSFTRAIERGKLNPEINRDVTLKIADVMEQFEKRRNMVMI